MGEITIFEEGHSHSLTHSPIPEKKPLVNNIFSRFSSHTYTLALSPVYNIKEGKKKR